MKRQNNQANNSAFIIPNSAFLQVFPDEKIVHALSAQLTWTHFREIIYLENNLQREFYAEMFRLGCWDIEVW